jgi:hypothetical protein
VELAGDEKVFAGLLDCPLDTTDLRPAVSVEMGGDGMMRYSGIGSKG